MGRRNDGSHIENFPVMRGDVVEYGRFTQIAAYGREGIGGVRE